jgi:hypothetical protein
MQKVTIGQNQNMVAIRGLDLMHLPMFLFCLFFKRMSLNVRQNTVKTGLWIRIRIGSGFNDFVDPDLGWESGSGGKKMKKKK